MKVTEVNVLSADRFNYVKVQTDEGLHGVGELHPASGTGGTPFLPLAGVRYCAEYLVGKDPLHIERHWQHMFRRSLFRGGADIMAAIGAIDIALWDIKGKACGKPVYELLGGPTREKVRLYTHLNGSTPAELAERAKAQVAEGFTAVRLYPFGDFGPSDFEEGRGLENMSFTAMQRNAVERVGAVRDAVGPDVDVMIDVVNRLTPAEAIAVGRSLEEFNLYFFEDPIEPENMDQWEYVASNVPMPLAMGERLYTIYQFLDLLNHRGAAFVRPDLSLAGHIKLIIVYVEIQIPVSVIIPPQGVIRAQRINQAGFRRHLGEQPLIIAQQLIGLFPVGDEQVEVAVIIIVAEQTAGPSDPPGQRDLQRRTLVAKSATAVIVQQRNPPLPARIFSHEHIRPTIVVVIPYRQAAGRERRNTTGTITGVFGEQGLGCNGQTQYRDQ